MRALRVLVALGLVGAVACSSTEDGNPDDQSFDISQAALTHASLAAVMPDHLAIMFSMSWFGIPKSDGGSDPTWGN